MSFVFLLQLSLLLVLSPLSFASTFSQELKFDRFLTEHGLSQSTIIDIVEDQQGFIWLATEEGLNRFDGENFHVYKKDKNNPNSIADNLIRTILVDKTNTLWVGTGNGLSRYNRKFDNFDNYYHIKDEPSSLIDSEVWDIYQDNNGEIWVSTLEGIHKYDKENNDFRKIRIRGFEHKLKEVINIYQDHKGNYWFGTYGNGIFISNESLSFTFSLNDNSNKYGIHLNADSLFDIKYFDEHYWLATNLGVFKLNNALTVLTPISEVNRLNSGFPIRSISVYDENTLWLASADGLLIFNANTQSLSLQSSSAVNSSLSSNNTRKVLKSSLGKMYVGTYKGLSVFSPMYALFEHVPIGLSEGGASIEKLLELPDGSILLSSESEGLNRLIGDRVSKIDVPFASEINTLKRVDDNFFIAVTYQSELFKVNSNNFSYKSLGKINVQPSYLTSSQIAVNDEVIWYLDNENTLNAISLDTEEPIYYQDPVVGKSIYYSENRLWVLNNNAIYTLPVKGSVPEEITLNTKVSNALSDYEKIVIGNSHIWLTSSDTGVLLIHTDGQSIEFNTQTGLINNMISSLVLDNKDNAWVTTTKGVSILHPANGKIFNFYTDYKLQTNEAMYSSAIISSDQQFYYGGLNGIHKVDTDLGLSIKQEIKQPILSNLRVLNKNIKPSNKPNSILKFQLSETDIFTLNHKDSPFTFEFVSPNAPLIEQLVYRYKLEGLDEEWIETDRTNKRATYTNLSAGLYTFKVEAFDKYHPEIRQFNSIKLNILPPWWLSAKAIFVYVIMAMAIVAYFIQQARYKRQYNLQIKKSEERLKISLWGSGDEMWDWNISTGKIYRSNIWGILDFPQDGRRNLGTDQTNIHPQDIPRVRDALNEHFADDSTHFEATYRVKGKNDKWMWILDRGKIVERDKNNEPTRMTGTLKDISHIKTAEERLKLFAKCIENISDAVIIYDRQFITVDVNKAYQKITGASRQAMLGTSMKFVRYSEAFNQNVKKHLITKGSWHGEVESLRNNNELYLADLNIDVIRDENNNISHFVGVFSDITERKQTEAELRKLANSDTLTGLPNRSYFQAHQAKLVNNKTPHALLVFDLDNFKKINDSMGHEVGDVLLCKVADRILNIGRKQDSVYRLGGDEFSLIIENTNDIHTITSIAKDILKTIAQPLKLKNQELVLYSSIGIVLFPEDGASPQELLKNADTAMYHAKDLGGNKYQFFSESMNKQAVKRLQIENLIRHGLKEDFFSVFYQPKIEISTGKVSGMEALVRFETPTKGIISPGVFIPVSEETGQIIDIGEVVLRKSCVATKKWVDAGLFKGRIAVNLSAVQFTQPNLVKMISGILEETGLEAKYLELEITEGTVMDSPQEAIDTMLQIRSMGIHLSLDDFGTGYSSLAYLKKFPLNTLKIDKAFVDDIEHSDQGRNMVATIVTIAHNLGLNVVAEGVETEPQLSFLSGLRCEQMQGYLYSKPLSEKDFQNYLLSYRITDKSTKFTS
ncbi:EAL domain-containing protein [Thalassotalea sp. LPB0316]|uniref:EAL domain-containing protein n=1 Tax=Thalassotalea sp. LPB0316 TaxID=2769490 RepID=UPI00186649AE|nr:EAL domain-containing protein [Thalassotalea sp. LPB0316]QOL24448.1 EAL domain-containing protein [Thalassotalea sp. LPB0316]